MTRPAIAERLRGAGYEVQTLAQTFDHPSGPIATLTGRL
jgi:hypothetical protein